MGKHMGLPLPMCMTMIGVHSTKTIPLITTDGQPLTTATFMTSTPPSTPVYVVYTLRFNVEHHIGWVAPNGTVTQLYSSEDILGPACAAGTMGVVACYDAYNGQLSLMVIDLQSNLKLHIHPDKRQRWPLRMPPEAAGCLFGHIKLVVINEGTVRVISKRGQFRWFDVIIDGDTITTCNDGAPVPPDGEYIPMPPAKGGHPTSAGSIIVFPTTDGITIANANTKRVSKPVRWGNYSVYSPILIQWGKRPFLVCIRDTQLVATAILENDGNSYRLSRASRTVLDLPGLTELKKEDRVTITHLGNQWVMVMHNNAQAIIVQVF